MAEKKNRKVYLGISYDAFQTLQSLKDKKNWSVTVFNADVNLVELSKHIDSPVFFELFLDEAKRVKHELVPVLSNNKENI